MAIRLMAHYLLVPLFHDITLWGRILSLVYRTGRIIFGIISLIVVNIFLVICFALWLILPPFILYKEPWSIFTFLILAFAFAFLSPAKKRKKLSDFQGPVDFLSVASEDLGNTLQGKQTTYALLSVLLGQSTSAYILTKIGLDPQAFAQEVQANQAKLQTVEDNEKLKGMIIEKAVISSSDYPDIGHLFSVLIDTNTVLGEILNKFDLEKKDVLDAIAWVSQERRSKHTSYVWDKDFDIHALAGVNRTLEGAVTPTLNTFIRDLTLEAKTSTLPPVVERKELVDQISLILSRSEENNVVLVGEPGCGKTYLVYGLAQKIIAGGAPPSLRFKRVVALDYTAVLGGVKTDGEVLERMKKIIDDIEYSGNIILYLDEIQNLITGESKRSAVYSALEPHLATVKFQVIASTSFEQYHATLEQNAEFANLFQKIEVGETSDEETLAILKNVAPLFEKRQKVTISYTALLSAIELSKRYIHDRVLPDKAVSILDEAAVIVATHSQQKIVSKEDVAKVISFKSHVPITKMTKEEKEKLLDLEKILHQRMVDQEEAVSAVADALRRARAGLIEGKRPIASFLFIGPTGVGKTELARTLAEFYFGNEQTMIRFDMSEFQTKESIYSLIGPPMGQKGAELGGRLTEAIRRRPFSLLLLDEMEKAHPDILNLFLQVMDEARLTDSSGKTVDFSNAIIIATSNAGTSLIQEEIGKGTEIVKIKEKVGEFLKTLFRPEFLNRFDGIIVFKPLSRTDVAKVAKLMIDKLTDNLTEKGIKVETTPQLLTKLAEVGYDPTLGARPLRRLIQDKVEAKVAKQIIKGELKRGSTLLLNETILNEN